MPYQRNLMVVAACLEVNIETLYKDDFGYSDIGWKLSILSKTLNTPQHN